MHMSYIFGCYVLLIEWILNGTPRGLKKTTLQGAFQEYGLGLQRTFGVLLRGHILQIETPKPNLAFIASCSVSSEGLRGTA